MFGLRIEEPEEEKRPDHDTFFLWPCNVQLWSLWWRIQTQWVVDDGRKSGLNYESVIKYLKEVVRIRPRKMPEVFCCLQAMERAAIDEWDKQRAERQETQTRS